MVVKKKKRKKVKQRDESRISSLFHDIIFNKRGGLGPYTSLIPPLFIEVPVRCKESEWSCYCDDLTYEENINIIKHVFNFIKSSKRFLVV